MNENENSESDRLEEKSLEQLQKLKLIEDLKSKRKSWWREPKSIISMITAFLAGAAYLHQLGQNNSDRLAFDEQKQKLSMRLELADYAVRQNHILALHFAGKAVTVSNSIRGQLIELSESKHALRQDVTNMFATAGVTNFPQFFEWYESQARAVESAKWVMQKMEELQNKRTTHQVEPNRFN